MSGIVTAAAGDPAARFSGATELFFPRGGDYALAIPDAESLESTGETDKYGLGGEDLLQPLETIDDGSVSAPHYGASNLAFKKVYYSRPLAWGGGIGATLHRDSRGEVAGTVSNQTGQPLSSTVVVFPGTRRYATLGDLAPGQTRAITMMPAVAYTTGDLTDWQPVVRNLTPSGETAPENTALLLGQTDGENFGPPLGHDVGAKGSVRVVVSLPIEENAR